MTAQLRKRGDAYLETKQFMSWTMMTASSEAGLWGVSERGGHYSYFYEKSTIFLA